MAQDNPTEPESLLVQIARPGAPPALVTSTSTAISVCLEACAVIPLGGPAAHVNLPLGSPVAFSFASDSLPVRARWRIDAGAAAADQLLFAVTTSTGAVVECHRAGSGPEGRVELGGIGVPASRAWFEVELSGDGMAIGEGRIEGGPAELVFDPDAVAAGIIVGVDLLGPRHHGASDRPTRTDALVHIAAALERLERIDGWDRTPNPAAARVEVIAGRRHVRTPRPLPHSELELVDFLSESWQQRIDSNVWCYVTRAGVPVDEATLDAYGRAGGIVCYVPDRRWAMPEQEPQAAVSAETPAGAVPPGQELYSGPRSNWVRAVRCCEIVLYQAATLWYLADQHDQDPAQATTALTDALTDLWHPAYAHHLDTTAVMARALGRFRYSDPDYEVRGLEVLDALIDHFASRDIASSAVVRT